MEKRRTARGTMAELGIARWVRSVRARICRSPMTFVTSHLRYFICHTVTVYGFFASSVFLTVPFSLFLLELFELHFICSCLCAQYELYFTWFDFVTLKECNSILLTNDWLTKLLYVSKSTRRYRFTCIPNRQQPSKWLFITVLQLPLHPITNRVILLPPSFINILVIH